MLHSIKTAVKLLIRIVIVVSDSASGYQLAFSFLKLQKLYINRSSRLICYLVFISTCLVASMDLTAPTLYALSQGKLCVYLNLVNSKVCCHTASFTILPPTQNSLRTATIPLLISSKDHFRFMLNRKNDLLLMLNRENRRLLTTNLYSLLLFRATNSRSHLFILTHSHSSFPSPQIHPAMPYACGIHRILICNTHSVVLNKFNLIHISKSHHGLVSRCHRR